ncbi:hypothetical protein Cgig2_026693 [Carnegiea gigantea]|uniref:NAC domain-containing protein n=1 Tax=Carnegiea gigantea TaxID=171969 RepID=A0A9Q1JJT0_9CARY|nr:hypothetical protein Cgig2_026693 [Carnegiea gigantea]
MQEEWVICRIFHKHGGSENKKSRASPTNYINNFMMNSCLPPLLETPTTTITTCSPPLPSLPSYFSSPSFLHPTTTTTAAAAAAASTAALPPPSSAIFDDFPQLPQCLDEDNLPSHSAIGMTMKQENNQYNWLDKIIAPQHQLIHLNPSDLVDDGKFGDVLHPTNFGAPDCFPDHAEMCASLAAAAALDRLLDHPPVYQPLSNELSYV